MTRPDPEYALLKRGGMLRSQTLENIFKENAGHANCTCDPEQHDDNMPDCPRAIWLRAARAARLLGEE
jgi:hypothetical protein